MVDVMTEIIIHSTLKKVSEYTANPDHAPEWYVNIKSAEWKTPKELAVGSLIVFNADFLGRRLAYIYEIVEYIPSQKMVMQTTNGPFPMETIYKWEAIDDKSTRMTLRNKGNPTGFSKIFTPFMARLMRRANMKDLKKLKGILEQSDS